MKSGEKKKCRLSFTYYIHILKNDLSYFNVKIIKAQYFLFGSSPNDYTSTQTASKKKRKNRNLLKTIFLQASLCFFAWSYMQKIRKKKYKRKLYIHKCREAWVWMAAAGGLKWYKRQKAKREWKDRREREREEKKKICMWCGKGSYITFDIKRNYA